MPLSFVSHLPYCIYINDDGDDQDNDDQDCDGNDYDDQDSNVGGYSGRTTFDIVCWFGIN